MASSDFIGMADGFWITAPGASLYVEGERVQELRKMASIRERLADLAHRQWAGWMHYMFERSVENPDGSVTIPADLVARWRRQVGTPYAQLPPNEQESDRLEADRVMRVFASE